VEKETMHIPFRMTLRILMCSRIRKANLQRKAPSQPGKQTDVPQLFLGEVWERRNVDFDEMP
jgi:hypothetical protein